ncbi:hypothetical protein ADUPG1_003401, partial [Aduncisulcus paluster]
MGSIPTSVLFYGCRGTGKTLLARSIAHSVRATFIDISPATIFRKFPGDQGITDLLILSFEVAKANAPSIIYIDQADYLTPPPKKKKPKKKKGQVVEEELEEGTEKIVHGIDFPAEERYSRIHKTLLKMINDLRKDNPGVVVIGCANDLSAPSVQKTLLSTFELLIPIPLPDYQT